MDERTVCNYATFLYKCCWHRNFNKKNMLKVFRLYRKSIQIHPDTNAYSMLGDLYWECGEYKHAEKCYQRAIRYLLDNNSGYVLWNLAVTQVCLQYYEKAYYTLQKFLTEYQNLVEEELEYTTFYSLVFYCLYRMNKDKNWHEKVSLNYIQFKEKVPDISDPTTLFIYYIMGDYKIFCRNVTFLMKDSWWISKPLFLMVISALFENKEYVLAKQFYQYSVRHICELANVYDKCYFKIMINQNHTAVKDEIITNFIWKDIIQNGIISSPLFYKSLYADPPI